MAKKDSRIKYNLLSGIFYQVILIGLSFLLPRLYLENFGSEVNGVLSTLKQIFMYMMLLEAGIGLATTQALYKPVAQQSHDDINSILAATHRHYMKTGVIYTGILLVLAVVYAYIIPTSINSHELFVIIILIIFINY